jgi:hypothetical protein
MPKANELSIPPGAQTDAKSVEIVRAWVAHEGLHCSINPLIWKENEAIGWGVLLSDIARHVADALYQSKKLNRAETLAEILRVFEDELESPTGEVEGGFTQ